MAISRLNFLMRIVRDFVDYIAYLWYMNAMQKQLSWVEISKEALTHNIEQFRAKIGPDVKLCPCVKANAYGHGLIPTSNIFLGAGADWLAVNALYEAEALREAEVLDNKGDPAPIYIMGYTLLGDLERAWELDCRVVVYDIETIERLSRISQAGKFDKPLNLHIKVETGNNRQGVRMENLVEFAQKINEIDGLRLEGIGTHFANIEDTTDHTYAMAQLDRFKEAKKLLEEAGIEVPMMHCANSAATILFDEVHFDLARVGISSYGMWPSNETKVSYQKEHADSFSLQPALTWKSVVAQVKSIPSGDFVGYGCTCRMTRKTTMAIVPVGYYDGYDRHLSNKAHVLIRGKRAKVIGRICMNIMMVDVSDIEGVSVEDEVVLMGKQEFGDGDDKHSDEVSAEQFAEWIGTINYEVTTRINDRIKRIVVPGGENHNQ